MAETGSLLRFGKAGLRAQELSDDALWQEVRARRRARGRGVELEEHSDQRTLAESSHAVSPRTRQSVAQWYANLELEAGAPLAKVREAYDRLSHQFRPEQHKNDPAKYSAAKELMRSLNHAYESLSAYLAKD